jgi:hypothetical protein
LKNLDQQVFACWCVFLYSLCTLIYEGTHKQARRVGLMDKQHDDDLPIEKILEQTKDLSNPFDSKTDEELMELTVEDLHDYQLKFLK